MTISCKTNSHLFIVSLITVFVGRFVSDINGTLILNFNVFRMRNRIQYVILIIVLCSGCRNSAEVKLSEAAIQALKNKYSVETINYFHEVAFFNESKDTLLPILSKWGKNPIIYIYGNPTKEQLKTLNEAIDLVNGLKLSIDLSITTNKDNATINIYFGDDEYLRKYFDKINTCVGRFMYNSSEGNVLSSKIAIKTVAKRSTIFEELFQSLGLPGDSYSFANSIFFEVYSTVEYVNKLDISLLSLLYDPLIPFNLSLREFERAFSDILHNVNIAEKIKDYVIKNKISKESLENIRDNFFNKGVFYKYPKRIKVHISGDYEMSDSLQMIRCMEALNSINANINLTMVSETEAIAGIYFTFEKVDIQDDIVKYIHVSNYGLETMIHRLVCSFSDISYIESEKSKYFKKKFIVETLYKSLGATKIIKFPNLYSERDDKIYFGEKYIEMLDIVYSDVFESGYKLSDIEKLIEEMKPRKSI